MEHLFHERPGLQQPGGRILDDPHERLEVRYDIERAAPERRPPGAAGGASSALGCIPCRPGPDHVEVPRRKQRVVPAPDVAQDRGLKFRHDVQGERRLGQSTSCRKTAPAVSASFFNDQHHHDEARKGDGAAQAISHARTNLFFNWSPSSKKDTPRTYIYIYRDIARLFPTPKLFDSRRWF